MLNQQRIDGVDGLVEPLRKAAGPNRLAHGVGDALPLGRTDLPRQATVGHDLDLVFGCSKLASPLTVLTMFGIRSARRWYWLSTSDHDALTCSSRRWKSL